MGETLAQRAEACFLHAWPALREVTIEGWLLRFAGGVSRRANSVNPLCTTGGDFAARIAACEYLYRDAGLPTLFRVHDLAEPDLDAALAGRGYSAEGETLTLCRHFAAASEAADVELQPRPSDEWFAGLAEAQGLGAAQRTTYRDIVAGLQVPAVFAASRRNGRVVSVAYGALHDGLVAIESVATVPDARGQGFARRTVSAVLSWARARNAGTAVLQVAAANAPALRLYAGLGFATELYRYHYRRQPG